MRTEAFGNAKEQEPLLGGANAGLGKLCSLWVTSLCRTSRDGEVSCLLSPSLLLGQVERKVDSVAGSSVKTKAIPASLQIVRLLHDTQ